MVVASAVVDDKVNEGVVEDGDVEGTVENKKIVEEGDEEEAWRVEEHVAETEDAVVGTHMTAAVEHWLLVSAVEHKP